LDVVEEGAEAMPQAGVSSSVDDLLMNALGQGGDTSRTGRYLVSFKREAKEEEIYAFRDRYRFRVASARDFKNQALSLEAVGDAEMVVFPEISVALVGGDEFERREMNIQEIVAGESPVYSVDPEHFMFAHAIDRSEYLKGFARAAQIIAADLGQSPPASILEMGAQSAGATWGLTACSVPPSKFSGNGISIGMLDTGLDLGHPDFAGRQIVSATFVGQPVQDLHGHGTHTTGTASGPVAPTGSVPRYGIAYQAQIFVGKVLTNSGVGTTATILAGMNWAIANGCQVISMSLGGQIPVQPAYTNAGSAALSRGCLIIAAAGNASNRPAQVAPTGAPANSPSIMSVAAVDINFQVAPFSNGGKIEIAGPGVNIYSSFPRPMLYNTLSGTSMATPHVSGVAALWAESNPSLRGSALWTKLQAAARSLSAPASDVGSGLVQAP
jgi:subtilisin